MSRKPAGMATAVAVMLAACGATMGVQPEQWLHTTEADFEAATFEQAIVTNLGELQLSRAVDVIAELTEAETILYDITRLDSGATYIAAGPSGKLMRLVEGELEPIAEFDGAQVFTLEAVGDEFWVAVSGAESRLERRDADGEVQQTIALPEVRYVWDIEIVEEALWLAAGGTEPASGKVLLVDPEEEEPTPLTALETTQNNVLCLGVDGDGRVYAGTDGEGLIFRITTTDDNGYEMYVVYDADEPEIGALLVQDDGTVYAGTADAEQARPGRLAEAREEMTGRPETPGPEEGEEDGGAEMPNVPPAPEPQPGEAADGEAEADAAAADEPAAEAGAEAEAKAPPVEADRPPAPPSAQQYDELREVVAERLEAAREGKRMEVNAQQARPAMASSGARRRSSSSSGSSSRRRSPKKGNAVYRISPDGFVREVFRESVMILRLALRDDKLIVATGNEGQIYRVDPDAEEVTVLADLDPKQVPALLPEDDGGLLVATANPAALLALSAGFAEEGKVTSDPLDAGQISRWGAMKVIAMTPAETGVQLATRSGNISDPEAGGWSPWTDAEAIRPERPGRPAHLQVASPSARFLQYRLTITSDGESTPRVDEVSLKFLQPNLRPQIASIKTEYVKPKGGSGDEAGPRPLVTIKIEWEAEDPNDDQLRYLLEMQPLGEDVPFIPIAEELTDTSYEWNTRAVPDGRYLLRVTASDRLDNLPGRGHAAVRRSDPVVIDNTAPEMHDVEVRRVDAATAQVDLRVLDNMTDVAEVRYSVNGEKTWQAVLPDDMIYDSTEETVSFSITGLSPSRHVISVKASDSLGNSRYVSRALPAAE